MFHRLMRAICTALLAAAACAANAQSFPSRTLTVVVPFGAGTSVDANGRDFAQALSSMGKTAVVDNKAGAEGTIGAMAVLNAPADGHMLMFTSSSIPVLDPLLKKSMPFDPVKDFTPICTVARTTLVANITGSSPIRNVAELVAAAKASPGRMTFAYSSASTRLAGELFAQSAGVSLTSVSYKTSAGGLTDLASGVVDLFFIDHLSVGPLLQSGRARALAVASERRTTALPNVPSAREVNVPGFIIQPWFGVYVSAKTPPAVVTQLRELMTQALNTPTAKAATEKRGQEPLVVCGEQMARLQADEINVFREVMKKANISPE